MILSEINQQPITKHTAKQKIESATKLFFIYTPLYLFIYIFFNFLNKAFLSNLLRYQNKQKKDRRSDPSLTHTPDVKRKKI